MLMLNEKIWMEIERKRKNKKFYVEKKVCWKSNDEMKKKNWTIALKI